jgi:hypothetical protein
MKISREHGRKPKEVYLLHLNEKLNFLKRIS